MHHPHERVELSFRCGVHLTRWPLLVALGRVDESHPASPRSGDAIERIRDDRSTLGSSRPRSGSCRRPGEPAADTARRGEPPRGRRRPRRRVRRGLSEHAGPPSRASVRDSARGLAKRVGRDIACRLAEPRLDQLLQPRRRSAPRRGRSRQPVPATGFTMHRGGDGDHRARLRPRHPSQLRDHLSTLRAPVRRANPRMPEITIRPARKFSGHDRGCCVDPAAGVGEVTLSPHQPCHRLGRASSRVSGRRSGCSVGRLDYLKNRKQLLLLRSVRAESIERSLCEEGCQEDAARATYSAAMTSRMRAAVSLGVLPTLTPAASRASFFAWAVPDEPETIAPA